MFGRPSRSTRAHHAGVPGTTTTTHHHRTTGSRFGFGRNKGRTGTFRQNRARGLQASLNNPNTTSTGRAGARAQLTSMGQRPNKVSFGTRVRSLFGMGGRPRNRAKPVHSY